MKRVIFVAYLVVTTVVTLLTVRLAQQSGPQVAVDWPGWAFAVACAYAGMTMFCWWLRARRSDDQS